MDGANVFLLGGFLFLFGAFITLCATLGYYITTKKFNKYGIVTYGKILGYEHGEVDYAYGDSTPTRYPDELYVQFELENQEHRAVIYTRLPSWKKIKEEYAIGSTKKIKVLRNKKGRYEARLLKENKENASYQIPIILSILTIVILMVSIYFFLAHFSYKEDIVRKSNIGVNYNKALDNPYIERFATITNKETVESMNTKFGVQGKLENPNISQASYVWEVKDGLKIKGTINSEGKVRSVELEAQEDEFYDNNVNFANDISTLNGKPKITYEDVKAKCGGIDGNPTRISNGMATTYVWVNSQYKLTITVGNNGYVTSAILKPR